LERGVYEGRRKEGLYLSKSVLELLKQILRKTKEEDLRRKAYQVRGEKGLHKKEMLLFVFKGRTPPSARVRHSDGKRGG